MKKIKKLVLFNIIVILITGCHSRTISERKIVKILAEMHFMDALCTENGVPMLQKHGDSTAIYASILTKYNTTMPQLYLSLLPYTANKDKMAALYEKVVRNLEMNDKHYAEELGGIQNDKELTNAVDSASTPK